ncbi:FAS1 domain [Macleaya cordata]|uniref:FAS1 domain n=1 Tax=Macleaya cordata TaxID=56857 RepID=A0A200RBN4_MACCD|nr:FAS1 domain [Macleaya cordata]
MQLSRAATGASLLSLCLILLLSSATDAHNITKILAQHPEFSTFNHYLTLTHLAPEINRRETITVCAVDNAGMAELLSKQLSIFAIKNVLSLHILLDYFGAKKLHQITNGTALAATMFQATGSAPGSAGFVNITDLKGGKVGFGAEDNDGTLDASYVKSVKEIPYNISVIQISKILPSPVAEAPTPGPAEQNLTALMTKKGCKIFADLLIASGALTTFQSNLVGGLTVFCPLDDPMKEFMPKYKNLTADGKIALLSYHGEPIYQSMDMLKSNNGLTNTLATEGAKYQFTVQNDGEVVTLKTKIVTAKVIGTVIDEDPLAIFTINKVLLPKELFKASLSPTPAPAPAPEADADSPKGEKATSAPEPFSPEGEPADQTADDKSGSVRSNGGRWVTVILGVWLGAYLLA